MLSIPRYQTYRPIPIKNPTLYLCFCVLVNKDELQHQSCQAGHEHKDSVDGNPVKVAKVTEKDGSKDLSIQELLGCYTEPRKVTPTTKFIFFESRADSINHIPMKSEVFKYTNRKACSGLKCLQGL